MHNANNNNVNNYYYYYYLQQLLLQQQEQQPASPTQHLVKLITVSVNLARNIFGKIIRF